MLDQLLANAVMYSEADRPVVVSAAADKRWVRVSVADFGIGMTADEAARSFEHFWRAKPAEGSRPPGYRHRSLTSSVNLVLGTACVGYGGITATGWPTCQPSWRGGDVATGQERLERAEAEATRRWEALWGDDRLLLSLPGMGPRVGPTVRAFLGDARHFSTAQEAQASRGAEPLELVERAECPAARLERVASRAGHRSAARPDVGGRFSCRRPPGLRARNESFRSHSRRSANGPMFLLSAIKGKPVARRGRKATGPFGSAGLLNDKDLCP